MLTQRRLKQLLHYDPLTGEWHWLVNRQRVRAGARAGIITEQGRRRIRVDGKHYYSARLAVLYMTGKWPDYEVDHENRIRNDDRWSNLRPATTSFNNANKPVYSNNTNGLKGVTPNHDRFMARIMKDGRSIYLGTFATAEAAAAAYAQKAKELFGSYASS